MSSELILPMQKYNISLHRGKAALLENIWDITSCFEESRFETENRRQECICMIYAEPQVNIYLSKYNWKCSGSFPVDLFLFCKHCFHTWSLLFMYFATTVSLQSCNLYKCSDNFTSTPLYSFHGIFPRFAFSRPWPLSWLTFSKSLYNAPCGHFWKIVPTDTESLPTD